MMTNIGLILQLLTFNSLQFITSDLLIPAGQYIHNLDEKQTLPLQCQMLSSMFLNNNKKCGFSIPCV